MKRLLPQLQRATYLIIGLLALLLTVPGYAQQTNPIRGTVTDGRSKEKLPGVTILIKGSTRGTATDAAGNFSIAASPADVLTVSFIGYETQNIPVGNQTQLSVALAEGGLQLAEVVVTALGVKQDVQRLSYAIQSVAGRELSQAKDPNLINSLAGRMAGVQVTNGSTGVGSTSRVVIRGESSLSRDNQPLFVVDGVPISNQMIANNATNTAASQGVWQETDYGNGAGELNAEDIEEVTVLKGANAAALYGSRAANGVILITTRSGKRDQKGLGVSISSNLTMDSPLRLPRYQNEYGEGKAGQYSYADGLDNNVGVNDGIDESWGPRLDGRLLPQFDSPAGTLRGGDVIARGSNTPITPTPWTAQPNNVKDFFQTGRTYTNTLALTGGNENGSFRLSYTNLRNTGILPNTNLKRDIFSLKTDYSLSQKLKAVATATFLNNRSDNRPSGGYGSENIMYTFTWFGRQVNPESLRNYWQAGQEGRQQFNYNNAYEDNPYFTLYENTNGFNKNRLLGNVALTYSIRPNLSLLVRTGVDYFNDLRQSRRAYSTQRFLRGGYREDRVQFMEQNTDFLLTYEPAQGRKRDLNVTMLAGGNAMRQDLNYLMNAANELTQPGLYSLNNSRIPLVTMANRFQKQINSVYGVGRFDYQGKLYLDASVRNDWSSTLPATNRSYFYPSASASWVLTNTFSLPKVISFAKLRAGWAKVGNDTDPYNLNTVFVNNLPYGSTPLQTESGTLANSQLLPELLTSQELGMDVRLFNGRLYADATYYRSTSRNQIFSAPISSATGFTNRFINGGEVRNQGVELTLGATPVKLNNGFRWDLTANFTRNVGRVVSLPQGFGSYTLGTSVVYSRAETVVFYNAKPGERVGDMYGTGFQRAPDGQIVYSNGLPVASDNLIKLGNYNPDFMVGLSNQLGYKGLSLNVLLDWRQGGTFLSRTQSFGSRAGQLENTLEGREGGYIGQGVKNAGTTTEPRYIPNDVPVTAELWNGAYYNRRNEEPVLFDASYLKLREVRLTYSLPAAFLNRLSIREARVGLVGRNLALFTENPNVDPETLSYRGGRLNSGVEDIALPSTRSMGVYLNLNF